MKYIRIFVIYDANCKINYSDYRSTLHIVSMTVQIITGFVMLYFKNIISVNMSALPQRQVGDNKE